jgi:hypothetical protein
MSGIVPFIILLIIRLVFSVFPGVFEILYFKTFFPFLRLLQSLIYPIWLVPGYLVLILLIPGLVSYYLFKRKSLKHFLTRTLNLVFWLAAVFLLCFGMQYADPGIAERLNFKDAPESIDLSDIYYKTMEDALEKRSQISGLIDSLDITQIDYRLNYDSIHIHVKSELLPAGYRASDMDQYVREIPFFILRKLSISGIYNPFTGESNVEGSLPTLMKSFVSAHELAHAAGITGEGDANFVAWLCLANSGDPYLEYAAAYFIWRQVAKPLNEKLSTDQLEKLAASIPDELNRDRRAIYNALNQEQPWYPELSSQFNDTYLKIQGVESGVDDYDKFLELYLRYQLSLSQ